MKAVILAGGRGSRFGKLTDNIPKPLIRVANKPLIFHVLEAIPAYIEELIIVVNYLGELIYREIGSMYKGLTVKYVEQAIGGTGGALISAKNLLRGESMFLVVGSDDIFGPGELSKLSRIKPSYGVFYGPPNKPIRHSVIFNRKKILLGHEPIEDPHSPRLFGVGAYTLPQAFFSCDLFSLPNGYFSIPHTLLRSPFGISVVQIKKWLPVNTLAEKERAERIISRGSNWEP